VVIFFFKHYAAASLQEVRECSFAPALSAERALLAAQTALIEGTCIQSLRVEKASNIEAKMAAPSWNFKGPEGKICGRDEVFAKSIILARPTVWASQAQRSCAAVLLPF
jgi:hypothetical protein